ncbi:MAG: IS4 family transposase [Clostridiales bacterium]|nr:IS4 family transposase [Clostridiales bacterium]
MKRTFLQRTLTIGKNIKEDYIEIIRTNATDFIRKRKITLSDLFLQMIANKGRSQKNELFEFYREVKPKMDISATAFFNARMKFNPEALLRIMQDVTFEEYNEPDFLTQLNNYYVFAIDGSDVSLPATDETRDIYGHYRNQHGESENTVLSSISTLYDCINELFLDIRINPYKFSEKSSASDHMNCIKQMMPIGADYLTIFDRGYASIRLIDQMITSKQNFLIRLPGFAFKREQQLLTTLEPDQWIDICYDNKRANQYRTEFEFHEKLLNTTYHLRFVRLLYHDDKGNEHTNVFITNISKEIFPTEEIYNLYHLRWNIETSYRSLKSQIGMENFSGLRDRLIRQDIYAAAFVHNNISMIIAENTTQNSETEKKHHKYENKINRNYALGVLKHDLVKMYVLFKDKKATRAAQKQFEKDIMRYSCPIRKGRTNPRQVVGNLKNKTPYRKTF